LEKPYCKSYCKKRKSSGTIQSILRLGYHLLRHNISTAPRGLLNVMRIPKRKFHLHLGQNLFSWKKPSRNNRMNPLLSDLEKRATTSARSSVDLCSLVFLGLPYFGLYHFPNIGGYHLNRTAVISVYDRNVRSIAKLFQKGLPDSF